MKTALFALPLALLATACAAGSAEERASLDRQRQILEAPPEDSMCQDARANLERLGQYSEQARQTYQRIVDRCDGARRGARVAASAVTELGE